MRMGWRQLVAADERRVADEHLVDENAEAPPVHALAVPRPTHHLRREVLGRAAQRPRSVLDPVVWLLES